MAAHFALCLGLRRPCRTAVFLSLSCLITTVSCQSASTSLSPLNVTDSYQPSDHTNVPGKNGSSVSPGLPTASPTPQGINTQPPTKSVDLAPKESASVDRKSFQEHSPLMPSGMLVYGTPSAAVTPTSSLYKLASVYKVETETPSKPFLAEPMSSVVTGLELQPGITPAKSFAVEPTPVSKLQLYESATLSSSQYSLQDFLDWTTKSTQPLAKSTEFQTQGIFPSHYYTHYSTTLTDSTVQSADFVYPIRTLSSFLASDVMSSSSYPSVSMSASPPVDLVNASVSHTSVIFNTPALSLSPSPLFNFSNVPVTKPVAKTAQMVSVKQMSTTALPSHFLHTNFSTSDVLQTSWMITNVPSQSTEFVTDDLFTSETQGPSSEPYYTQDQSSAISTPTLSTSIPDWFGNSSTDMPLPPVGLNESVSHLLDVPSTSLQYPLPVVSPSGSFGLNETASSLFTEISAAHNETYLPSAETIYPTTEMVFIKPSETIREYDELLTSWSDFPTESYYTDYYYYEDTSTLGYVAEPTEYLPDFPPSSTITLPATAGLVETSGIEKDHTTTEGQSETVIPLSPTLWTMSSSVHSLLPVPSMNIQTSSEAPGVATVSSTPQYVNQKYILTFNGDCQPLVSNAEKAREFQAKVKDVLEVNLVIDKDSIYMDRVACGSVESHVLFYNASQNYSSDLSTLVSSGKFLVEMTFPETNTSQTFRAYKVEEVDFENSGETVTQGEAQERHLGDKDVVLIVLACVICAVLIIIGIVVCARHMYSKKYAQSFNLMDTRHANLKMDDYTLTQFPLPRRSYGEDGIQVQSYYQTNGQALLPPHRHNYNSHNQSSDLDSTLERSVDVGDIRLDGNKHSSFATTTRTFDFSPSGGSHLSAKGDGECPLPSTSMDSSSSAHDRSTENLVPGLGCSTLHGSVNPIYSGDDTEGTASVSSDPPPYTDTNPQHM